MQGGFFSKSRLLRSKGPPSLVPRCGACGLLNYCKSPKMPVKGEGMKRVLVIGEGPGKNEDEMGRPFVGKAGQYLRSALEGIHVDLDEDCWTTNAIICRASTKEDKNRPPTDKEIAYCRPNVLNAVRDLDPEVIILLGNAPLTSFIGHVWKEDPGGISRWAGYVIPCRKPNAWVVPTYHPSHAMRGDEEGNPIAGLLMRKHLKAAFRKENRPYPGGAPDNRGRVRRLFAAGDAATAVRGLIRAGRAVAFDFETDRLKPDHPESRIVCCSVSDGETTIAYPWVGEAIEATRELVRSDLGKIASNAKFEHRWVLRHFGCRVRNWVWDTMLAAHVLDNRSKVTSIKYQAFVLLGETDWASHIKPFLAGDGGNGKNRIHEADLSDLLEYNGLDSLFEFQVAQIQAGKLGVQI